MIKKIVLFSGCIISTLVSIWIIVDTIIAMIRNGMNKKEGANIIVKYIIIFIMEIIAIWCYM